MLFKHYPELEPIRADIDAAVAACIACYKNGGKLLIAGNGGSAADSEHIVGELMKGFLSKRTVTDARIPQALAAKLQGALPAISLSNGLALPTAYLNDVDAEYTVAQTLYGLAKPGDVFIGISTSGNAKNLCHAAELAKCLGVTVIAMTGEAGGKLAPMADVALKVPSRRRTFRLCSLPMQGRLCPMRRRGRTR